MRRRGQRSLALAFVLPLAACSQETALTLEARSRPVLEGQWSMVGDRLWGDRLVDLSLDLTPDGRVVATSTTAMGPLQTDVVVAEETTPGDLLLRDPAARLGGRHASPRVLAAADGAVFVAWTAFEATRGTIVSSVRAPSGVWRDPASFEEGVSHPPHAHDAQLVASGVEGFPVLHWVQKTSSEHIGVAQACWSPTSMSFQRPRSADDVVSAPKLFVNHPRSAGNSAGDVLLSWYQSVGGPLHVFVAERRADASEFVRDDNPLSPKAVGPEGLDGLYLEDPQPALHDDGSALVAWVQPDGRGNRALFMAERVERGPWKRPQTLEDSASDFEGVACCPAVLFAPSGAAFVAWKRSAPGERSSVLFAHRRADGVWVVPPREPLELDRADEVEAPQIAITYDARVVVVWRRTTSSGSRIVVREASLGAVMERAAWTSLREISRPSAKVVAYPRIQVSGQRTIVGWLSDGAMAFAQRE